MNTKNNQRFHETEIRMEAAMLNLMKNIDFEKITVKKICEEANVNRSTFYAHFTDIYNMLDKMEQELRKELLKSYSIENEHHVFSEETFVTFLEHIEKHRYFYKINLQTRKSFPLSQGFDPLWSIIKPRCEQAGIKTDEEIMYYFIYFQAGFTMILKHWVDSDCVISKYDIAKVIKKCIPKVFF